MFSGNLYIPWTENEKVIKGVMTSVFCKSKSKLAHQVSNKLGWYKQAEKRAMMMVKWIGKDTNITVIVVVDA